MTTQNNDDGLISFGAGFYVRGQKRDGNFLPEGEVQGDGELATSGSGQPGWMELSTGQFYPMHTAKTPISPYVNGFRTDHGFVPSTREIR